MLGVKSFTEGSGIVTDAATDLQWTKTDSGSDNAGTRADGTLPWSETLSFCEEQDFGQFSDWRLPDTKEL
jgi:hypothetical protein